MKTMKRLFAAVLCMALVMSMAVGAFADHTASETAKITLPDDGHTYNIYQIMTGTPVGVTSQLTSAYWGKNAATGAPYVDEEGNTVKTAVSQTEINALTAIKTNMDDKDMTELEATKAIAAYVDMTGTPYKTSSDAEEWTETKDGEVKTGTSVFVEPGYYLIEDASYDDTTKQENKSYSLYVVEVASDVDYNPKREAPQSDKKVYDEDDSTDSNEDWMDSADHDVGDDVQFRLHAALGEDADYYEKYTLIFHDQESTGLTFNPDSVEVTLGRKDDTHNGYKTIDPDCYQVVTSNIEDGCTFHVVFEDVKAATEDDDVAGETDGAELAIGNNSNIYVYYTSTLNDNAKRGYEGNPNEMWLEYTNTAYPEGEGEDTDTTPKDKVIVFTYNFIVDKVDQNGDALTGAEFELYKWDADKVVDGSAVGSYSAENTKNGWVLVSGTADDEGTKFTWAGIDDGWYKLVETESPESYQKMADKIFSVSATHSNPSDDPELEEIVINIGDFSAEKIKINQGTEKESEEYSGVISGDVVNTNSPVLPETGGIGTTIFMVVGSVMMIGAVVLMISRKKMSAVEED